VSLDTDRKEIKMANVIWDKAYPIAEAERSKFVEIDKDSIPDYPEEGRGKWAVLTYDMSPQQPISLSGDMSVAVEIPNSSNYYPVTISPNSISTVTFLNNPCTVEVFNNSDTQTVYVGFNNTTLATLSAAALPLLPKAFYSIQRATQKAYIGNASGESVNVRVISHYKDS